MSVIPLYCCPVAKLCWTFHDPMDCSTPGFLVLHCLPEFAQTQVHWVDDAIPAISSSVVPFSSCLQSFPASGSLPMSQLSTSGGQSIGASAWVLSLSIQGWFPLGLTGKNCKTIGIRATAVLGIVGLGAYGESEEQSCRLSSCAHPDLVRPWPHTAQSSVCWETDGAGPDGAPCHERNVEGSDSGPHVGHMVAASWFKGRVVTERDYLCSPRGQSLDLGWG